MTAVERILLDEKSDQADSQDKEIYEEHKIRYRFAAGYAVGKRVLDIACGSGYGSQILGQAGAKEVWGGDISYDAIDFAKSSHSGEDVHFRVMEASDLPFEDDSFEMVVSFETIEHLDNPKLFIQEIYRVLKPNGKLILSTPNKSATRRLNISNPYHIYEFKQNELLDTLNDFSHIDFYYQRPLEPMSWRQKVLHQLYFIYTKLPFFYFLKYLVPKQSQQSISASLKAVKDDFDIVKNKENQEYLYFIVVAEK